MLLLCFFIVYFTLCTLWCSAIHVIKACFLAELSPACSSDYLGSAQPPPSGMCYYCSRLIAVRRLYPESMGSQGFNPKNGGGGVAHYEAVMGSFYFQSKFNERV